MKHFLAVVFSLVVFGTGPGFAQTDPTTIQQIIRADTTRKAPVVLARDTLFFVEVGLKSFPAERRAAQAGERITEFAEDLRLPVDSVRIIDQDVVAEIVAGDRYLFPIYEADAIVARISRMDLADRRAGEIRTAVARYREDRSRGTLLKGILLSVGATLLLVVALRWLAAARRRLEESLSRRLRGITYRQQEVVPADWLRIVSRMLIRALHWLVIVVLLYGYFEFVLSRFIWTRTIAEQLLALTLEPLRVLGIGLLEYLPNLFFLVVLYVVTRFVIRFLRYIFLELERGAMTFPGFYPEWGRPTFKLVRILVIAFSLVVAFPYIPGSTSPAFQGLSIFLGVLFSLGSTSAVANGVAGVIITYMRSFKVGDVVKIQDTVGIVVGSQLLVTRVRTFKNVDVTIPNSAVLGTHVVNYTMQGKERNLILHSSVTIGYDAPWRQVHSLLRMAAARTDGLLKDPPPFVLQNSLDDFFVTYELNAYCALPDRMPWIYSDLHSNIQDAFNEYGVQIMSPHFIADKDEKTYVPKARWFEAPATKPGGGKEKKQAKRQPTLPR